MRIGIDIGSTTIKCVLLNENNEIVYQAYERHFSLIKEKLSSTLSKLSELVPLNEQIHIGLSGSAGMGLAQASNIDFIQEVFATKLAVQKLHDDIDVVIELGGEDAKILFLTHGFEARMNGTCAGGTGAFIDQMASLLDVDTGALNELSRNHQKIYTIATRCGVFAKSDIQPLLNQGATKEDLSASILHAVAAQTITGLAQGRSIEGKILYLGGPLTFLDQARVAFDKALNTQGISPDNSLYYVAYGSALGAENVTTLADVLLKIEASSIANSYKFLEPLFKNEDEVQDFIARHNANNVEWCDPTSYQGSAYLGIDAGSTTLKMVIINQSNQLLYSSYQSNKGNLLDSVKSFLVEFMTSFQHIKIVSACVTGYGEELIKNAFNLENGIVETIAHFYAAKYFEPDVDFIIDIGGQDMKCFKILNGQIDHIFLNEACSSGCGSFLQTFASALGYEIEDFSLLGIKSKQPVDLGSRCTVFMNSLVKQAQKDGASIEDISAGLSISVVKNALYKVIRTNDAQSLGKHIVVQGGTFRNNCVLRAFEKELGINVTRPAISELMGAFGCALYAMQCNKNTNPIITLSDLENFQHTITNATCGLCNNHCSLSINTFANNQKFISGNRCERPVAKKSSVPALNLYDYKRQLLDKYHDIPTNNKKIGIPFVLNMYDLLPFWYTFFHALGYDIILSNKGDYETLKQAQATIPSDTVCYPAKLVHQHIFNLLNQGVDTIFYPCMSYNVDEHLGDNHYNCPLVAYYPEVIKANVPNIDKVKFISEHIGIHNKEFEKKIIPILKKYGIAANPKRIKTAYQQSIKEYQYYHSMIHETGLEFINKARKNQQQIIVLAGRPYHIDEEINHGIDHLLTDLGACVISEDVLYSDVAKFDVNVLNQWTYHSRMFAAAKYICDYPDMNLIQLVSFGCGIDAITTDEIQSILFDKHKPYTQIKIDEITNLGTVKIRLRSLFATLKVKGGN